MPIPSAPPPSNEPGALTQPRQLQRWLDVNVVPRLTRTQGYFTIPAFSVDAQWRGYSSIVAAFNYTATNNFSLKGFVSPVSPGYLATIMWVDDEYNVYRYKLWENVGEMLHFDCPLYSGQLVKQNFRIEIWSCDPDDSSSFILTESGTSGVNQEYTQISSTEWGGTLFHVYLIFGNIWEVRIPGFPTVLYTVTSNTNVPFGCWSIPGAATAPAPYTYQNVTYAQTSNMTFYTSVRGSYDYRFSDDFALATASTIITDFAQTISGATFTLPLTWPTSSVPVLN